jgi:hypothetical protein
MAETAAPARPAEEVDRGVGYAELLPGPTGTQP